MLKKCIPFDLPVVDHEHCIVSCAYRKKEYIKLLCSLTPVNLPLTHKSSGSWINGNWTMSPLMNCNN